MVRIEGYSPEELLALPRAELDAFVFMGRPVVVKVGTAEVAAMVAGVVVIAYSIGVGLASRRGRRGGPL